MFTHQLKQIILYLTNLCFFIFQNLFPMVILSFVFIARTQNVLSIQMPQESDWHVKLQCGHCKQQFPKQITFNKNETVQMTKQHGIAHFGASCKNCDRKCYISIDQNSPYVVKPDQNGNIKQSIAKMQCRGCQIVSVDIGNSLTVKLVKSGTIFQNADFTDLWCEVDPQTDLLAQVQDVKIQIVHHK